MAPRRPGSRALEEERFTVVTVFAAYSGESYADIPTVQQTVGFVPPATRTERELRTLAVSDFAAELGVPSIATHIGFVPEDRLSEEYVAVQEVVRRVCDHAAARRQTFALETGQESADALLDFLLFVNRDNLGVNFDPANMILYGTGDPIAALRDPRPARSYGSLQGWRLAAQRPAGCARRGKAAGTGLRGHGAVHCQAPRDSL